VIAGKTVPSYGDPGGWSAVTAGTWVQMTSTLASVEPSPTPSGNPVSKITAWTGFSVNTTNSKVYAVACGGHTDYAGNEVDVLDLETAVPAWAQLLAPTANASLLNADYYADGRPSSRHNYHSSLFDETANKAMLFGGSRWSSGAVDNKVDSYDVAGGAYSAAGTHPDMPSSLNNQEVKAFGRDSRNGNVYAFANFNVAKWTRSSNTWSSPISGQTAPFAGGAYGTGCAFDSTRNRFFLAGGGVCWTYDPDANTATTRTLTGTDFSSGNEGVAIVYESTLDVFLVRLAASGGSILQVHPTTFAVSTFTTSGGSSVPAVSNGPWTKFLYVPRLGGCVYVPEYSTGFWFLKTH
jgi:hypothetical protein